MALAYKNLAKQPNNFLNLTGLTLSEFDKIVEINKDNYQKNILNLKKSHGRNSKCATFQDKLLCLMIYYRTYMTHTFLGYLFNMHNSNVCRMFKMLEKLIVKKNHIQKDRTLTEDKILNILADVTEIPIQRHQKKQNQSYSGKKKRHTLKTEVARKENGKIIFISNIYKGKTHDFKIRKLEKPFNPYVKKYVDSGYQGYQKLNKNVILPFKKSKKRPLNESEKEHNKKLFKLRSRIENKFAELKIFKILGGVYRNFQKKLHLRVNILAGIVNLKNGF